MAIIEIIKHIFLVITSIIRFVTHIITTKLSEPDDSGSERRPSPSLVPVPFHVAIDTAKDHLTVSKYGDIPAHASYGDNCVVCLAVMKEYEAVRVLPNCSHVFHKDCIDAWIDSSKTTCPVCRSDLMSSRVIERFGCGEEDPWRSERMVYLFGEDFVFSSCRS